MEFKIGEHYKLMLKNYNHHDIYYIKIDKLYDFNNAPCICGDTINIFRNATPEYVDYSTEVVAKTLNIEYIEKNYFIYKITKKEYVDILDAVTVPLDDILENNNMV